MLNRHLLICARWVSFFCVIVIGSSLLAQDAPAVPAVPQISTPTATANPSTIPGSATSPLSPGDLIDYTVFGVPEMTQRVRLDSKGIAYLPLLNEVDLSGLTVEQAQQKLEELLISGGYLRNPHVTVSVAEYANGISLLGEINRPGVYPVAGARRLYDVIAAAGGLTANAGTGVVITHKNHPDEPETYRISRDPSKAMEGNVLVNPGDTVMISRAPVIYVVGEVVSPSGFLLDDVESLTVLKAIAMAHGTAHGAKLNGTKVIRKQNKKLIEIPVPLSKIMSAKADDIPLQADDIVFVPSSAAKSAARKTIDTAISLATGVTLIRTSR